MATDPFEVFQGRDGSLQFVHFIRFNINHEQPLSAQAGILPVGSVITSMKFYVKQGFTGAKLSLGSKIDGEEFGKKDIANISIQDYTPTDAKAFVAIDKETRLFCKRDKTSTAGSGVLIVQFVPNL